MREGEEFNFCGDPVSNVADAAMLCLAPALLKAGLLAASDQKSSLLAIGIL